MEAGGSLGRLHGTCGIRVGVVVTCENKFGSRWNEGEWRKSGKGPEPPKDHISSSESFLLLLMLESSVLSEAHLKVLRGWREATGGTSQPGGRTEDISEAFKCFALQQGIRPQYTVRYHTSWQQSLTQHHE